MNNARSQNNGNDGLQSQNNRNNGSHSQNIITINRTFISYERANCRFDCKI